MKQDHTEWSAQAEETIPDILFEQLVYDGFVFINGTYVPPPYIVRAASDAVWVNSRLFAKTDHGRRSEGLDRSKWLAETLAGELDCAYMVIVFPDRQPIYLRTDEERYELCKAITDLDLQSETFREMLRQLPGETDRRLWVDWLTKLTPSHDLRRRAEELIHTYDLNDATVRANLRIHDSAYPLLLVAMVLGVIATGHQLTSHPKSGTIATRSTIISIGLIGLLSAFDLAWTMLAYHAGVMRELNPIGKQLMHNPTVLVAFKLAVTLVGCGILLWLRNHRIAQLASWWLCLVCTLLLFRWILFYSIFVT